MSKLMKNDKGVSEIVGMLLIFMMLMTLYTTIQVTQVPVWNAKVESEHMDVVYGDMTTLKSDIENAATLKTPMSSDIHMGVKYPDRIIFINPGVGVAGTLSIENDVKIRVDYTLTGGDSDYEEYNSSRIIYEAHGTINSPKLVYEHGVIIRDWGTANITTDTQSLIVNGNIYIPVVNGSSSSKSSLETESLNIKHYTSTSTRTKIKYVNITMDTKYPGRWKELLKNVNTSYTTAYVSGDKIIINTSATRHIVLPTREVTTGALYAGIITCSTSIYPQSGSGWLGRTNIDPTKPYYPTITGIDITYKTKAGKKVGTITATVTNVTSPYDIHADLSDITGDPLKFDELPDSSDPGNYLIPPHNSNTVKWIEFPIRDAKGHEHAVVTLWAVNTDNDMQYVTTITEKLSGG